MKDVHSIDFRCIAWMGSGVLEDTMGWLVVFYIGSRNHSKDSRG
jgi:hypothetical protein